VGRGGCGGTLEDGLKTDLKAHEAVAKVTCR
jgi:hypothetical protein